MYSINRLSSVISKTPFTLNATAAAANRRLFSTKSTTPKGGGDDEWNVAWETAWLPDHLSPKTRAPWETDVHFSLSSSPENPSPSQPEQIEDAETKAFVEDMNDNWEQRRGIKGNSKSREDKEEMVKNRVGDDSLYSLQNVKKDYRVKKQRVHSGLWMKEIEKYEEAKLRDEIVGNGGAGGGDDIDKLLDTCSEIFYSGNNELNNPELRSSELKSKPDGWETTSKTQDGNVWEMSQREEDILLQEFERRIAFSKFQIASFIKTHIFSRRRPIDGWKYMIEELGPNAKKGKGSVSRVPSLADPATQPFKEEKIPIAGNLTSYRGR